VLQYGISRSNYPAPYWEVMSPGTRGDGMVDIGPQWAGGNKRHMQVQVLPAMSSHIEAYSKTVATV
jgi:hypothetical protein